MDRQKPEKSIPRTPAQPLARVLDHVCTPACQPARRGDPDSSVRLAVGYTVFALSICLHERGFRPVGWPLGEWSETAFRDIALLHRSDGAAGSAGVDGSLAPPGHPGSGGVCRSWAARARQTSRVVCYRHPGPQRPTGAPCARVWGYGGCGVIATGGCPGRMAATAPTPDSRVIYARG